MIALVVVALIASRRAAVQRGDSLLDSLVVRVQHGDTAARRRLEPRAWKLVAAADVNLPDASTARATARVALAMAAPLSPPEAERTERESTWRGAAVRALRRALAVDSGDVWSAGRLEAITPYPYIWLPPSDELAQLRAISERDGDVPTSLALTRIRLEIEVGSVDSASRALTRLSETQVSAAERLHIEAELAFALGDTGRGRVMYYMGAAAIADSVGAASYTLDLAWIAQPNELGEWRALDRDSAPRVAWLRAFWARRDLQDGQLQGTRLVEQFRRWRVALRHYRWDSDGSVALGTPDYGFAKEVNGGELGDVTVETAPVVLNPINEINRWRAQSRILDDRGALVMRHGDPIVPVQPPGITAGTEQNLAWLTPQGRLIVGFSRIALGSTRFGMVARNRALGDPATACLFDPRYCSLQRLPRREEVDPSATPVALLRMLDEDYSQQRAAAEHSDGNAETFRSDLAAVTQVYGIPEGGALVVIAVPINRLVADPAVRGTQHEFGTHLRIVLGDSARGRIVATLDTTRRWTLATAPGPDAWLTAYVTVPVAPGDWDAAVVVSDAAHRAGTGTRVRAVPVIHFDSTLRLGDPIIGSGNSGLVWHYDGILVPLNPTNVWHKADGAILTYQLGGLVMGRSYQSTFELWKANGHTVRPSMTLRFAAQATAARQTVQRELSLRELPPGDYRLVIRVRDPVTNAEAVRERRLAIRK
jgi:hypothetical protein